EIKCVRVFQPVALPISVGSAESTWNAMRWALLGPTPGSRPSSSMRSWIAPSYPVRPARDAKAQCAALGGALDGKAHAAETAGERTHLLLGQLAHLVGGVGERGGHQVLQRLHVV